MATLQINTHGIEICNSLLRGELSAVATYDQAIEKLSGDPQASMLNSIREDHRASVGRLQETVTSMGGSPETDSGAWGVFATTVQTAANLLGDGSALASLKQGEEHGKRSYESALADEELSDHFKKTVRDELLPRINNHLEWIEKLSATV